MSLVKASSLVRGFGVILALAAIVSAAACGRVSYDSIVEDGGTLPGAEDWVRWVSSDDSVTLDVGVDGAGRATLLTRLEGQLVGDDVPNESSTNRATLTMRYDASGAFLDHHLYQASDTFELRDLDVADGGSSVATGSLSGTVVIAGESLDSGGNQDVVMVVAESAGEPTGAVLFSGGGANAQGHCVAGSPTGAIALGGLFGDEVQLTGLPIAGAQNADIAFHGLLPSIDGTAIWGIGLESPDSQAGSVTIGLDIGQDDRVCVTGYFEGPTEFGSGGAVGDVVGDNQSGDVFVAEYSGAGLLLGLTLLGSVGADRGFATVAVADGCVVAGRICGASGGYTDDVGDCDAFVAKVTGANVDWSVGIGGTDRDVAWGLDVGASGTIYVGGVFTGAASLGALQIQTVAGSSGAFIAALDAAGNPLWLRSISGDDVVVESVAVTTDEERLIVAGEFQGTLQFAGRELMSSTRAAFISSLALE